VAIVGFPLTSTKVRNFEKIKEKLNKTGGARVLRGLSLTPL